MSNRVGASAAALLDALRELPLAIDDAACVVRDVALAAYPGGRRPSAVVTLIGRGSEGRGEHVAWERADHEQLRGVLPSPGRWKLGGWADAITAAPYARAALEAAGIDLALRQQQTNLFRLARTTPRPIRYVVSFDRRADPASEARRLAVDAPGVALKVDADPGWGDDVYAALANAGTVAVVDFKLGGTATDHARAHAALPDALLEDPALDAGPWAARVSFDQPVRRADDVARLPTRPAAINVKPARMGGVFEALRTVAACQAAGIPIYVGGMWEVDVGRRQLQVLAALFSPDAPNDVAPLGTPTPWPPRLAVAADADGFG